MSVFELRAYWESMIPWWVPVAVIVLVVIAAAVIKIREGIK